MATNRGAGPYGERLLNLSTRAETGAGEDVMITGFIIAGSEPKKVLLRAVGPRLAREPFSMAGTLSDPLVRLYDGGGTLLRENDNWEGGQATTFAGVGAFPLDPGSRDAALVETLAPGPYTAHVAAASGPAAGITLVEVYDVSGAARLINLSTRAHVGTGNAIVIPGIVVGPSRGPRQLLVRAAGPALRDYGVADVLPDPALALVNSSGVQIASNDDWGEAGDPARLREAFEASGAYPFPDDSHDAALLADLPAGLYTLLVSGVGNTTGITLVEVYDLTPQGIPAVSVEATAPATEPGGAAATFTVTRAGDLSVPLTVSYALGGTGRAGLDYVALPGIVTIPAGEASATVHVVPLAGATSDVADKSVTLSLARGDHYEAGASTDAAVTILRRRGALFVANLRPSAAAASTSVAYGTATLQLSEDERRVLMSVSFSNLSSPQTVAYLRLGAPDGLSLMRFPNGQVTAHGWTISSQGEYSFQDVVAAIKAGQVYVSIDSASFPGGELQGAFIQAEGVSEFRAPAAAPEFHLGTVAATDAARFLMQATFGPTSGEIEALRTKGYRAWLDEQIALAPTLHTPLALADFAVNNEGGTAAGPDGLNTRFGSLHRLHAWWWAALHAPDQLRQRVAFALSEIFVLSDLPSQVGTRQDGVTHFYDLLVQGAFGNFRDLLEQVTRNPMMGIFLSHLRNAKATGDAMPDENFAREVMQLFTIGLRHLNPDGTLKLDAGGLPSPTYTQETVSEMARVFTGWSYHSTSSRPSFRSGAADYINPMMMYPNFHDDGAKTIVAGITLPAGQGGSADLKDALDALFNHPNTGPFVSRQLIQRLVTSNPSPGYVYRVAQAFADNGAGVRGDLAAVVRAILLDYEARSPRVAATLAYGKLKEPLLRLSALFRVGGAPGPGGRYAIWKSNDTVGQSAVSAQSVFNFFEPEYVQPGELAAAGLVGPEFQILTDTFAVRVPNHLHTFIYNGYKGVALTFDAFNSLAATPEALVAQLDLLFCAGSLSPATRDRLVAALTAMPPSATPTDKTRAAVYLAATSPAGAIQK
ncbi:MAG TPA: DUF1800 family protein [Opitutaceae bacterium]